MSASSDTRQNCGRWELWHNIVRSDMASFWELTRQWFAFDLLLKTSRNCRNLSRQTWGPSVEDGREIRADCTLSFCKTGQEAEPDDQVSRGGWAGASHPSVRDQGSDRWRVEHPCSEVSSQTVWVLFPIEAHRFVHKWQTSLWCLHFICELSRLMHPRVGRAGSSSGFAAMSRGFWLLGVSGWKLWRASPLERATRHREVDCVVWEVILPILVFWTRTTNVVFGS